MSNVQVDTSTRRDAMIGALSLLGLAMPAVDHRAVAAESSNPPPFREADWRPVDSQLASIPECRGERLIRQPEDVPTCKVMIDDDGVVFLNSVQHVVQRGISQPCRREPNGRLVSAPVRHGLRYSLKMLASGAIISVKVGERSVDVVATNGHVLAPAKVEIRRAEFLDPLMDLSVVERRVVIQNALDTGGLPIGRLAEGVTDNNLTSKVVSFCSKGRGHFRFTGKPSRIGVPIPSLAPAHQHFSVFVMRVPSEMGDIRNELVGLSGSPVYLEETREIVGVFAKCYPRHGVSLTRADGSRAPIYVLFAGPNSLRARVMACATRAAER